MGQLPPIRSRLYGHDCYSQFDPSKYDSDLQGWGSEHAIFEKLIDRHRPSTIIEVGTWKGASAVHMGMLCRRKKIECEIVAVDTWLGTAGVYTAKLKSQFDRFDAMKFVAGWPTIFYTFLKNVTDHQLQNVITPFPQTSENAAIVFKSYKISADMIYIDAAHEYAAVIRDLRQYWPLVKPGGCLFGDDYNHVGVNKAVKKFTAEIELEPEISGRKYVFTRPA